MKYTIYYAIPKPELSDGFDVTHWHTILDKVDSLTHQADADITILENGEATRQSQESTRQTNEGTRQTQEGTRQSNEAARNTEFESWRTQIENSTAGDMTKAVYDKNVDGIVDKADVANKIDWAGIQNNPITYTPENSANKGIANGYAPIGADGFIPSAYVKAIATLKVVNDIAARDALDKSEGLRVHVLDATGDPTVTTGWAEYMWTGTEWKKTAEKESIDVIYSYNNLTDLPASFVPSAHNHTIQDLIFAVATTTDGQTQMTIPDATFNSAYHRCSLHRNGIPLNPGEDYSMSGLTITFVEPLVKNATITTTIRIEITKVTTIY